MVREAAAARPSAALRLAQRAWKLLQADSARSLALAERARTLPGHDDLGRAWAQLVLGFNALNLSTPAQAIDQLDLARQACEQVGDRTGAMLAETGIARAWWRQGRLAQAHTRLMQLRDEGLQLLRHEQRGVLLNAIAGSYSVAGNSEQAFAYMYSALRDTPPAIYRRSPGGVSSL